jgi:hypothetical protein
MTKHTEVTLYQIPAAIGALNPRQWIAEGQAMARTDPAGVFDTIEIKNGAEVAAHEALVKHIDAKGAAVLAHWTTIKTRLEEIGFDIADHLHQIAHGKLDLILALALLAVGAVLTAFVLFAYAPLWLTILLAFLVLASAVAARMVKKLVESIMPSTVFDI